MAIYTVTYDLLNPGKNYDRITGRVAQYDSHKAQYSQWLVNTAGSASELRADLSNYIDANDKLAVFVITPKMWASANMPLMAEWLAARGH